MAKPSCCAKERSAMAILLRGLRSKARGSAESRIDWEVGKDGGWEGVMRKASIGLFERHAIALQKAKEILESLG
jgi:hypothetical protein